MRSVRALRGLAFLALATLVAGCGGHASSALPARASTAKDGPTTAALRIVVPKGGTTTSSRRSPRYISPATQSMTVLVTQHSGGATVLNETAGLTPTSAGCTSTLTTTICTLNLPLGPGTYDMTLATYDGYDSAHNAATGTELSSGQNVDFTIVAGTANTISVTLSGIPASLAVFTSALAVHGTSATGYTLYGTSAQKFTVVALDPDGDVIVGPGAPAFTISTSGSGFTITNPATATPNTFALAQTGTTGQTASFTATAAYGDSTCSIAGAVCTTIFSVTSAMQTLFVSNYSGNTVTVYGAPYGSPAATISLTNPTGIATDSAGDLFAGDNVDADVHIYAPPYTGTPITAGPNGAYTISYVMVAPSGTLFAGGGTNVISVAPPYTGSPAYVTQSAFAPKGMALDASGDLFVPNQNNSTVDVFAPPYTGSPTVITSGLSEPEQVVLDASGNLFVANFNSSTVTEYAPPYTGSPIATLTTSVGQPGALAIDAAGRLFIANSYGVTIYTKPYTGTPVVITSGVSGPTTVVLDYADDVFVANAGNNTVTEYAPPYTGAPVATISTGVNNPQQFGLALYPH